jgi:GNAT superfamily N-acetyltransferase
MRTRIEEAAMPITIRPLAMSDRSRWNELWRGYQTFYGVDLSSSVTETTWHRLNDSGEPVFGLIAADDARVVGFSHYVFHRSTWLTAETCYLQDLFVEPVERGRGAARALIGEVYLRADARGAGQVYWLTHETNAPARRLYDAVASHSGFIAYERFAEAPHAGGAAS